MSMPIALLFGLLFLCLFAVVAAGLYWADKSQRQSPKTKTTEYHRWK